jgi:hypothetical protein
LRVFVASPEAANEARMKFWAAMTTGKAAELAGVKKVVKEKKPKTARAKKDLGAEQGICFRTQPGMQDWGLVAVRSAGTTPRVGPVACCATSLGPKVCACGDLQRGAIHCISGWVLLQFARFVPSEEKKGGDEQQQGGNDMANQQEGEEMKQPSVEGGNEDRRAIFKFQKFI